MFNRRVFELFCILEFVVYDNRLLIEIKNQDMM